MPSWSLSMSSSQIPPYIPIPPSARPIPAPPSLPAASTTSSASRSLPPFARRAPAAPPKTLPSLVPALASMPSIPAMPSTGSVASNVSDLVLSSLLPPNLPKLPAPHANRRHEAGVRELSTRKEALGVNVMSNNFRRFVTRVGPLFWLQDRVEEVLFWRKPKWTWLWMFAWTFVCFNPRALLVLPSLSILVVLLHALEVRVPLPSLLGAPPAPPAQATPRVGGAAGATTTTTTVAGADVEAGTGAGTGGAAVAVPPKEAESNVDYFMNLQAIQNLMGLISDAYDLVAPRLTVAAPTSPTAFPLTPTHIALVLLPPSLLLPLTPAGLIPYLLVPLGLAPPLLFHPLVSPRLTARDPALLALRARAEEAALDDALDDATALRDLARVEVWENERLDPKTTAWAAKSLRPGERRGWVKVMAHDTAWADDDDRGEIGLRLKDGWEFVKAEEWRVDVCAGDDDDGWTYLDDTWGPPADDAKKVTRRRRWYRRVCK
ncbi:hypothetical protein Q5752_007065 [Cryptotrichosporon argae]